MRRPDLAASLLVLVLVLVLASCGTMPGGDGSTAPLLERPACAAPRPQGLNAGYFAFFDPHSAVLSTRAERVLDGLAARWRQVSSEVIMLDAHTDGAEAGPADRDLAARRGEAVKAYLVAKGIGPWQIGVRDLGSNRPMIQAPPGRAEPQNRFVLPVLHLHGTPAERLARLECKIWLRDHCFTPSAKGGADADACKAVLDVVAG